MWRGTVVPQSPGLWDKPNALKPRAKEHPNDTTVGQPFMFHYALWPPFGASPPFPDPLPKRPICCRVVSRAHNCRYRFSAESVPNQCRIQP